MYVFQLFDAYSASGSALLWVSLFQSVAIGWIYGENNFSKNIGYGQAVEFKSAFVC